MQRFFCLLWDYFDHACDEFQPALPSDATAADVASSSSLAALEKDPVRVQIFVCVRSQSKLTCLCFSSIFTLCFFFLLLVYPRPRFHLFCARQSSFPFLLRSLDTICAALHSMSAESNAHHAGLAGKLARARVAAAQVCAVCCVCCVCK